MFKQYTIPIFVPHLGCPFDCVFCNQKKITGISTNMTREKVEEEIKKYLSYFDKDMDYRVELGFFGGSFTGIDTSIQEELLEIAYKYKRKGLINGIRISTRPDFIDQDILNRLKKYEIDTIELGVQSLDRDVLKESGRGHTREDVYNAVSLIKANDFKLGLQMMLGLPGDNFSKSYKTALEFVELEPECVRIYPTLVIRETALAKDYIEGIYHPLGLEEAIDWSYRILVLFQDKNINVIRLGLQVTENIQLGRDVLAGPFHAAFGELVKTRIYRNIIDNLLEGKNLKNKILRIYTENTEISSIIGNKKTNKSYFINKYKLRDIKIFPKKLEQNKIVIEIDSIKFKLDYYKEIKKLILTKANLS